MKLSILIALTLLAITSPAQEFINHRVEFVDSVRYETVKVIAEVYDLPHKMALPKFPEWNDTCQCVVRPGIDSIWVGDSTEVHTKRVIAWEVWEKKYQKIAAFKTGRKYDYYYDWVRSGPITYLAYNKKDTLTNVLQSWRVEW